MTERVITIRMDIDRAANTANCTMDITENGRSDFKSTSLQLIAMSRALTRFGSKLLDDAAYCIAEDEKEYLKVLDTEEQLLTTPLTECDLTVRAMHVLHRIGCKTLGDLVQMTKIDAQSHNGVGRRTYHELDDLLKSKGLCWRKA